MLRVFEALLFNLNAKSWIAPSGTVDDVEQGKGRTAEYAKVYLKHAANSELPQLNCKASARGSIGAPRHAGVLRQPEVKKENSGSEVHIPFDRILTLATRCRSPVTQTQNTLRQTKNHRQRR
jgi:hypothetical protein